MDELLPAQYAPQTPTVPGSLEEAQTPQNALALAASVACETLNNPAAMAAAYAAKMLMWQEMLHLYYWLWIHDLPHGTKQELLDALHAAPQSIYRNLWIDSLELPASSDPDSDDPEASQILADLLNVYDAEDYSRASLRRNIGHCIRIQNLAYLKWRELPSTDWTAKFSSTPLLKPVGAAKAVGMCWCMRLRILSIAQSGTHHCSVYPASNWSACEKD